MSKLDDILVNDNLHVAKIDTQVLMLEIFKEALSADTVDGMATIFRRRVMEL